MQKYIGVDLHKKSISVCVVDQSYRVVERQRFLCCEAEAIADWFAGRRPFEAVVEATASYEWFVQLIEPHAERVRLAHPGKLRVIAASTRKSDRIDAQVLADFLARGMIPEAHRPSPRQREHRRLVRHRDQVQRRITSVKCRIRRILSDYNADRSDLFTAAGRAYATGAKPSDAAKVKRADAVRAKQSAAAPTDAAGQNRADATRRADAAGPQRANATELKRADAVELKLSGADRFVLDELWLTLDHLRERRDAAERALREFAAGGSPAEQAMRARLATIPGVGFITIEVFLAETADVRRFGSQKKLAAYAGLAPGFRESAGKRRELGITHQGSRLLRWGMVQAAWRLVRHDPRWGRIFDGIAKRRGRKKAIVAVARRLLGLMMAVATAERTYTRAA